MTQPQMPASFADARADLGVRLYGAIPHAIRAREFRGIGAASALPAVVPIAGEVLAGIVLDFADGVMPISDEVANDMWGVGIDELLEAARENGRGRESDGITVVADSVYLVSDEQLAAGLLLDPAMLSAFEVRGSHVVLAPGSGVVLIAGSDDRASLAIMLELAGRVAENGEGLVSAVPLVATGSGFEVFEWPAEPTLRPLIDRAERLFRSAWYTQQKPLLEDDPAFVAKADVFEKDDQTVLIATWTRGVETLLPVVDDVMIVGDEGVERAIPFVQFIERPGVTDTDLEPKRYRVAATAQV